MGFLDHSTNNIIVDAVLTDYGRKQLAQLGGGGAGNLVKNYGFADTEVDYSMITKYGVIVGKEKIEKNTPIFEASTGADSGIHTMLYTTEDPTGQQAVTTATLTNSTIKTSSPRTTQLNIVTTDPSDQLTGVTYIVKFDNRFLTNTSAAGTNSVDGFTTVITIESQELNVGVSFVIRDSGNSALRNDFNSNTGFTYLSVENQNTGAVVRQIQLNLDYSGT